MLNSYLYCVFQLLNFYSSYMLKFLSNLLVILILFSPFVVAQEATKEDCKEALISYFNDIATKDVDLTLDHLYPPMFDLVPRETMHQAMSQFYADTSVTADFKDFIPGNVSELMVIEDVHYALIEYDYTLYMKFAQHQEEESSSAMTLATFNQVYGEENVSFDEDDKSFLIKIHSQLYAILDPAYEKWTFLEKKDGMGPLLEQLLPKEVLDKL